MQDAVIYGPPTRAGRHLSAQQVLPLASKSGYLDKRDNSLKAYMFPCWYPSYKIRFVVVAGGFIYKFKSENAEKPKGIPIPLDCSDIHVCSNDDASFEVYTLRKRYLFRGHSAEDCNEWVSSIKVRKVATIKEQLGHVQLSNDVATLNKAADGMFHDKLDSEGRERSSSIMNPIEAATLPMSVW